jgi:CheY-like chemotaxis protein
VAQSGALAGLRVLLVEDEMLVSLLIEELLVEQDCVVIGPYDRVPEALEVARSEVIHLAVLDVNIAGEKVYPVAEILETRGIPFLLLSGYGASAIPSNRPTWRVCSKPFQPKELIAMLAKQAGTA